RRCYLRHRIRCPDGSPDRLDRGWDSQSGSRSRCLSCRGLCALVPGRELVRTEPLCLKTAGPISLYVLWFPGSSLNSKALPGAFAHLTENSTLSSKGAMLMLLVIAFVLEFALWMRGFWPWDSDPVQIGVTVPIALILTTFSVKEFVIVLRICGKWASRV